MTRKELKQKIKEEQKKRANIIRILKAARKPKVYQTNPEFYDKLGYLESYRWDYRHIHIMYCHFFNNTPVDKIERKYNAYPNSLKLEKLRRDWEEVLDDEAVRISA